MCFVWIWEQTAIISLYTINWLVCITGTASVYCAVRTGSLNKIRFQSLEQIATDHLTDRLVTAALCCLAHKPTRQTDSTVTHIAPGNQRDPLSTRDWCIDVIPGVSWQFPVTINIWINNILLLNGAEVRWRNCGLEDWQVLVRLPAEARDVSLVERSRSKVTELWTGRLTSLGSIAGRGKRCITCWTEQK